jgi:hypothetical protein
VAGCLKCVPYAFSEIQLLSPHSHSDMLKPSHCRRVQHARDVLRLLPAFQAERGNGVFNGVGLFHAAQMSENPCGRVKYYRDARHPELNSPGNVLIGAISALFGEAQ